LDLAENIDGAKLTDWSDQLSLHPPRLIAENYVSKSLGKVLALLTPYLHTLYELAFVGPLPDLKELSPAAIMLPQLMD